MRRPAIRAPHRASVSRLRGAALVVALIAVVAMTAAAFALFRSVDDGQGMVAQYPLARSARLAVEQGLAEAAQAWLGADPEVQGAVAAPERDAPRASYWASLGPQTAAGIPTVLADLPGPAWSPEGPLATGWPGERIDPATHLVRRYAIERLCSAAGTATEWGCRLSEPAPAACAPGSACPVGASARVPWVRITVRVDGPRGTVEYGQAFAQGR